MTTVLRYAYVRTKGSATLWMDPATVHQGGWETTAISVRAHYDFRIFIQLSTHTSMSIVQLLALSQNATYAFNVMVQLKPYWLAVLLYWLW